ncbi:protein translocase subunit SecF [Jatrophihabitans endophyticus]|uniref:protein translocase subunit SecF n=1 Tax=Jatrophihabitans endophyticus TaxID=1206085 RepID=UPI001A098119|nr:protein translocase subunit SecF [Jatrophihabitans endophyticus]MBE7189040.1 protein translocase subunit SecF [Jatrophihabitans endophyticus]
MSRFTSLYRGETNIGFIASRRRWYAASGVIVLICVLSFIFRGFDYGIEFKGGTSFTINSAGTSLTATSVSDAFSAVGHAPQDAPQVAGTGSSQTIIVDTPTLSATLQGSVPKAVAQKLNISSDKISVDSVGSDWGHDTTVKALEGLIIFLVVVSIYISLRFQWRMAVGGIIALLHDIVVAAGIYSLVGFEVSPSTIVGLLTILGFSLYDTVVVYDKVGENAKDILAGSRMTFSEAANKAVNQTLMRSINTSLIALLPVAGLLFVGAGILGVGTIKDLALILFVGLLSGAYSSLFLATPIVVDLTERESQYKALTRRVLAKRADEAKRVEEAELAGVAVAPQRSGAPAPAPKVGARPQRRKR